MKMKKLLLGHLLAFSSLSSPLFAQCPTISAGQDMTICEGDTAQLNGIILNGGTLVGKWSSPTSFITPTFLPSSSRPNPKFVPSVIDIQIGSASLVYSATVYQPGCPPSISDTVKLTISKKPTANAGSDLTLPQDSKSVNLNGFVTNSSTSSWSSYSNGTFVDATKPNTKYTFSEAEITVKKAILILTATNSTCPSKSDTLNISLSITTSVEKNSSELVSCNILPNPIASDGHFYVETNEAMKAISMLDISGKSTAISVDYSNLKSARVDASSLQKGSYVVLISTEKGTISKRIMIQ